MKTVLIVDDEVEIQEILEMSFRKKGFDVLRASSGNEAIQKLTEAEKAGKHIDAVVSDMRMPNGNGMELLKYIKTNFAKIPIMMFMTGHQEESLQEAYNEGAEVVFRKPFDRKQLVQTMLDLTQPTDESWTQEDWEPETSDKKVEVAFPKLEVGQMRAIQFGRGGMFIAMSDNFPKEGDIIEFTLKGTDGAGNVTGTAEVMWIRTYEDNGLPPGIGIKFRYLPKESKILLSQFLKQLKPYAYIPKGPR